MLVPGWSSDVDDTGSSAHAAMPQAAKAPAKHTIGRFGIPAMKRFHNDINWHFHEFSGVQYVGRI
jgi:hypothetical protein